MTRVKLITIEMQMCKTPCMQHLVDVRTLCPDFDSRGMGDSQAVRITYRLYIDDPEREDLIEDVNRKLRAVEVICRDQRVGVSVIKDKSFDDYLQVHPPLMKLNQTLEARDD